MQRHHLSFREEEAQLRMVHFSVDFWFTSRVITAASVGVVSTLIMLVVSVGI